MTRWQRPDSAEVSIGIAGFGYWGAKLARNVHDADGAKLAAVCDDDVARLAAATKRFPDASGYDSLEGMLADDSLNAVILATPATMHHDHVLAALRADKDVLVEKPLSLRSQDCEELCAEAAAREAVLMVGHTFLYSEPVRYLRGLIQSGELGDILYVYSQRLKGPIREDLNALWDLGPHDISILLYLLGAEPTRVSGRQFSVLDHTVEDVAFAVLEFPGGVVGHAHTSWLDPRKVRLFTVVGSSKMAVYDDTDVESPIRIYDQGVLRLPLDANGYTPDDREGFGEFKLHLRAGDIVAPRVQPTEPLRTEVDHFVECVKTGRSPLTDGAHGRDVVAILEAIEQSAAQGGTAIPLEQRTRAFR